jgi:hypothetical protein
MWHCVYPQKFSDDVDTYSGLYLKENGTAPELWTISLTYVLHHSNGHYGDIPCQWISQTDAGITGGI